MIGKIASSPDLEAHKRASWKEVHQIWKDLYKEGSPNMALLPVHDLLSAKHGDTVPASVVQGAMLYGNATPKWAALAPNATATKKYLSMISGVPTWEEIAGGDIPAHQLDGAKHTVSGLTPGHVLTALTPTTFGFAAPAGGGGAHDLLSATHTDTTAGAAVAGDIIYADATPKWTKLAKGTIAQYLKGGDAPSWATLNQAAVAGLTTADGPTLAHLHLSDLAAIYTAAESWIGPSAATGIYFKGGNAGFGTATPGIAVDIYRETASAGLRMKSDLSTGAAALTIYNNVSHENSFYVFGNAYAGNAYAGLQTADLSMIFANNTNALLINSYAAYPLVFATTNLERMRILAGGAVLIGATAAVGGEKLRVNGQIYGDGDISALTFTDRTQYPKTKAEAYAAVMSMVGDGNGRLVHEALHDSIKARYMEKVADKEIERYGRNLSASVSCLNEVTKDLVNRVEKLEAIN